MTLIELLVASAIFAAMIGGTGYVYTQTSRAVSLTTARIEVNAAARSIAGRMRDDALAFAPDGLLLITMPDPNVPLAAQPPTVLLLTVSGRFQSRTQVDTFGHPVTANAAVIVYVSGRDVANPPADGGYNLLCRYVYLLSGDDAFPANLRELEEQAVAADSNAMDDRDVLGESLGDFRAKRLLKTIGHLPGSIEEDYVAPNAVTYAAVFSCRSPFALRTSEGVAMRTLAVPGGFSRFLCGQSRACFGRVRL